MTRTTRPTTRTTPRRQPGEPPRRLTMLHMSPKPDFRADELAPWYPEDNTWIATEMAEWDVEAVCIHRTCGEFDHAESADCPCCPVVLTLEEVRMPDWIDKAQSIERTN